VLSFDNIQRKNNLFIIFSQQILPISVALERVLDGLSLEVFEIPDKTFSLCFLGCIILEING